MWLDLRTDECAICKVSKIHLHESVNVIHIHWIDSTQKYKCQHHGATGVPLSQWCMVKMNRVNDYTKNKFQNSLLNSFDILGHKFSLWNRGGYS